MKLMHEYKKADLFLKRARHVCIISHVRPDGDTIASNIALRLALERMGKKVDSVCADPIPERYYFLPHVASFQKELHLGRYDCIVMVDIAAKHLVGFEKQQESLFSFFPLITLDHHPDNPLFGHMRIVDDRAASTTVLLYRLFDFMNVAITKDIATALLLGIYSDTGSFMHANTSQEACRISGELMSHGANAKLIVQRMYKYFPVNRLKLWGEVFNRMKMNTHQVVSSVVTKEDFEKTHTTSEDLAGVVEYLNMVPNSKFAMLMNEDDKKTQVNASLRTLNDNVDVSTIAHKFGGGGHKKASGFRINGKIQEEVTYKIVNSKNEDVITNISDI